MSNAPVTQVNSQTLNYQYDLNNNKYYIKDKDSKNKLHKPCKTRNNKYKYKVT